MRFLQKLFRRALVFYPQPSDSKMRRSARASNLWPACDCFQACYDRDNFPSHELRLHQETQNTDCDAWKFLENLVQKAIKDRSKEFAPGLEMPAEMWAQIITLPRSIAKLTSVRRLYLYGSHLVRIPVEIGEINLQEFDAYTSYRLHWLPFEITHCKKLKRSRISTRALYGNYKYRPPFPHLETCRINVGETNCSICRQKVPDGTAHQAWISLRVATDVLPLLANACSNECIQRLPTPPKGYLTEPHSGGLDLKQPQRGHMVRGEVISHEELMKQRGCGH